MHLRRFSRGDSTSDGWWWVKKQTVVIVVVRVNRSFAAMLDLQKRVRNGSVVLVVIHVVIIIIIIQHLDVTNIRRLRSQSSPISLGQISALEKIVTVVTRPVGGAA